MVKKNSKGRRELSGTLSLWALLVRGSFYKVLAVVLLLAVAEMALFCGTLQGGGTAALEIIMEESRIHFVFLAAFGAIFFLLIRRNKVLDHEARYTVMRLRVSQAKLFGIRTAYDILCLLVLFAAQMGLVLGFAEAYRRTPGMFDGPQLLFMAFYRSEFLHCLLPLADTEKWVRNGLMLLAMGMEEAGGIGKRYRTTQVSVFLMAAIWFTTPVGLVWQDMLCCFVYGVVIAADLLDLYRSCKTRERMEL